MMLAFNMFDFVCNVLIGCAGVLAIAVTAALVLAIYIGVKNFLRGRR